MKGFVRGKPELLAPAGSLDVFTIAVEEGADAVYVGAPALNARALAKHFTLEELAAMIDYGHRNGVKVYLAMNSLVREDEISGLLELLSVLEKLAPDALIIQDLGLYYLIKNFFPNLPIHASTLMAAHNSLAVEQFRQMGFKRVVLSRELTLAEIKKIHSQCPVELEVFVHGALCFSYSGLCLFSSYLGGKSGLRGRCVQPCRRRYTWTGQVKGPKSGYFFSMNDLEAVEQLNDIAKAGVVSFKIEGRMRSANYVGSVVKAYRKMIDAGPDAQAVLPQVHQLLHQAMGRKPTRGYFASPQPLDAITPFHSGNIGQFLGKILESKGDAVTLVLQENIDVGDRVRHHHEKSGDRKAFTIKKIERAGESIQRAEKDERIQLFFSGIQARNGDSLYKVDIRERRQAEGRKTKINPGQFRNKILALQKQEDWKNIYRKLSFTPALRTGTKKTKKPVKHFHEQLPAVWLKAGDFKIVSQNIIDNPAKILISLDKESYRQFQQQKKSRHLQRIVTWVLPPVILEDDVPFYRNIVPELQNLGFRHWMIGHIGQLQLFHGERPTRSPGTRPRSRPFLFGDYTLNVTNSLALRFLKDQGVSSMQLSIEADKDLLKKICDQKKKTEVGLTAYARPALFTARLMPDSFHFDQIFVSPKGERFQLVQKWGQTIAVPDKPFSLLPQQTELKSLGIDYVVIDLTFHQLHKKEMSSLRRIFSAKGKGRSQDSFNYFGSLQ